MSSGSPCHSLTHLAHSFTPLLTHLQTFTAGGHCPAPVHPGSRGGLGGPSPGTTLPTASVLPSDASGAVICASQEVGVLVQPHRCISCVEGHVGHCSLSQSTPPRPSSSHGPAPSNVKDRKAGALYGTAQWLPDVVVPSATPAGSGSGGETRSPNLHENKPGSLTCRGKFFLVILLVVFLTCGRVFSPPARSLRVWPCLYAGFHLPAFPEPRAWGASPRCPILGSRSHLE